MLADLILTVVSNDRPGVVEAVANTITENGGNWLESRLTQLAGKFAGVVRVQIEESRREALSASLVNLKDQGINIILESNTISEQVKSGLEASFHAVGSDRPGIVRELSHTFNEYSINVNEMDTRYSSMPYSGDPLFEAEGTLSVPEGVQLHDIQEKLEEIANALAIDISLQLISEEH